jgi:hypothetical protein
MKVRIVMTLAVGMLVAVSGLVRAQSGSGYDLTWYTIDNGGAALSTDDGYQLGGAIGQPDAGALGNGDYTLAGGFWQGEAASKPPGHRIYLPQVLR